MEQRTIELAEWQYRKYCTSEAKKALVGITGDFIFLFLQYLQHIESPRPGVESELQLQPMLQLRATPDL